MMLGALTELNKCQLLVPVHILTVLAGFHIRQKFVADTAHIVCANDADFEKQLNVSVHKRPGRQHPLRGPVRMKKTAEKIHAVMQTCVTAR